VIPVVTLVLSVAPRLLDISDNLLLTLQLMNCTESGAEMLRIEEIVWTIESWDAWELRRSAQLTPWIDRILLKAAIVFVLKVGLAVGLSVGTSVGMSVGASVGTSDGIAVVFVEGLQLEKNAGGLEHNGLPITGCWHCLKPLWLQ